MGVSMSESTYSESPIYDRGGGSGGGNNGGSNGDDSNREHWWNKYKEVSRYKNGERASEVNVGTKGYVYKVYDTDGDMLGKVTHHKPNGALHRHGIFSKNGKDDYI